MTDSGVLDSVIPGGSSAAAAAPSPLGASWAWHGANNNNHTHTLTDHLPPMQRFVSPFLQSLNAPTDGDEGTRDGGVDSAADAADDFRSGLPPIQTFRFPAPTPGFSHNGSADHALDDGGGVSPAPRSANSAKSPIGPSGGQLRKTSYDSRPFHGESAFQGESAYAMSGVSLTLTDDADIGGAHKKKLSGQLSPASSDFSAQSSLSHSHFHSGVPSLSHSQPSSRGEESFDALEKSLTDMIFSNSQQQGHTHAQQHHQQQRGISGSASTPQSANFAPQSASNSFGLQPPKSVSQSATPYQSGLNQSNGQTLLPPSSGGPSGSNSPTPPGSIAYIVLPNGQVQTVDMAAIQSALQPGATPNGNANLLAPPPRHLQPPVQQQQQQQQQQPSSRLAQQYHPSYTSHSTPPLHDLAYSNDPPVEDGMSFSLETLSTKTLPLYTSPPTPPPQVQTQHSMQANFGRASSNTYQQRPPSHDQPRTPLSHSAYSSPSTMSMQQRSQLRQQQAQAQPQPRHSNNASLLEYSHGNGQSSFAPSPSASPNPTLQLNHSSVDAAHNLVRSMAGFQQSPGTQPVSIPTITPTAFYSHHSGPTSDNMVAQAKSQAGSRMLQTKLQAGDPAYFTTVFEELYEALPELMVDLFGNYLCQKLITFANDTQRLQLLLKVLPELLEISCDRQGTRAIQKLIESLKHQHEKQMVLDWLALPMQGQSANGQHHQQHHHHSHHLDQPSHLLQSSPSASPLMSPSSPLLPSPSPTSPSSPNSPSFSYPPMPRLIHLIRDQNGSHVVHSILDTFPQHMLHNIQRNAMQNCRSLGVDQHGLCVLKKCLSMAPAADFIYFNLKMILEHIPEYVNNQYGNYLCQHIIERTNGLNHAGSSSSSSNSGSVSHTASASASALALVSECDDAVRPQLHVINDAIFRALRGSFARLSRQKFSSNVVEKMLKIPDATIRTTIVAELIEPDSIASLLQCSYGNYVLQNVLYVANQDECALLFARVRPEHVLASLRKNIRAKWERLLANAHLIHPGLAPGGSVLQPHHQHSASAPTTPAGGNEHSPDGSPLSGPMSTNFPINGGSSSYPTHSAIQLITSILGAGTPSGGVGGGGGGGDFSSGDRSSIVPSPSQMSPSMRGVQTSTLTANSPNFSSRPFGRSHSNSHGAAPSNFAVRTGQGLPSIDRRSSYASGPNSAAGSAVSSPHFNPVNLPTGNFRQSISATSSPHFRTAPLPHSTGGYGNGNGHVSTNFPVNASPMHAASSPEYHHQPHPRAPSAHSSGGGGGGFNHSHFHTSAQQSPQQQPQATKFPTGGGYTNLHAHPSTSNTGGSLDLTTPQSIQQQIQNTQNQLQALMMLQQAQAAVHQVTAANQQPQQHYTSAQQQQQSQQSSFSQQQQQQQQSSHFGQYQ